MSSFRTSPRFPILPTPLIGREREMALAHTLLQRPEVRLLTMTGPGGIGKTRLSLQIASDLIDVYADGVHFVPMAAVPDATLVPIALADALQIQEISGDSVRDSLVAVLREAETLLVIDNFEHLLTAAPLLTELLRACRRLKLLVTSRTLLRVAGEHALPVPSLDLPDADPPFEQLVQSPAVQLFTDRAQAVLPSFDLSETSAPIVAEICRRLDGMPLAIELAAARVTHLSLEALHQRLEQRLPILTSNARDRPSRHRTLRDAIAWSHDLLAPEEQTVFRSLAVFAGGFTLEVAEAVLGARGWGLGVRDELLSESLTPSPLRTQRHCRAGRCELAATRVRGQWGDTLPYVRDDSRIRGGAIGGVRRRREHETGPCQLFPDLRRATVIVAVSPK